jgi:hypothetical protein
MSTATEVEYGYVGDIAKWDENPDGTINVFGVASSPRTDLDGQQADPTWLKAALPEWFANGGNVREQHGMIAAGVGKTLEHGEGDKWWLKSHIVDPTTIAKVKAGVLKGYSIGARNGKVMRGKSAAAPGGIIVGGNIVEVSLVDRPCNPDSMITICKAAPGSDVMEFTEIEDDRPAPAEPAEVEEIEAEESSQDVDGAVDGDDDVDPLGLFDWDAPAAHGADEDPEDLLKAYAADAPDAPVTITKGLLEALINGPKDAKHKRDPHGKFSRTNTLSSQRRALRAKHEMERREARKHRQRSDAEHLQDAQNAAHAGRAQEAGEHRARLGSYDKALSTRQTDEAIFSTELTVAEWKAGMDTLRAIQSGELITKAERAVYDESDDIERAKRIVAELAELIISEAEELANGRFEEASDLRNLIELVDGMIRFCRAEEYQGGARGEYDTLVHKAAGTDAPIDATGTALDEPVAPAATVMDAEIVKALISTTEAQKGQIASLTAQMDEMRRKPIPGGPIANPAILKALMPAPSALPAHPADTPEYWDRLANRDGLTPEVRAAYTAKAVSLREG